MKRYSKIFCSILVLLSMTSCANKILSIDDLSNYSPDKVWSDPTLANAYLANLYPAALGGWPGDGNADITDGYLTEGAIQPINGSFKYWPYGNVRNINVLLKEIEGGSLKKEIKDPIVGQALFFRAWHYFKAVVYHGGVPYITIPQDQNAEDLFVSRNSTKECFDFILKDLNDAEALLPDKYTGNDAGRIDASAVLAFKARVMLSMASPQFNPSNPYGNAYIADAYTVNKTAYETLLARGYGLVDEYTNVFETKNHKEAIILTRYTYPSKAGGRGENVVRPISESKDGTGGDAPIWEFVEAFPMLDGKNPGESTTYPYNMQTYWENRDPRFEKQLVWNGALYELSGKKNRRQYTAPKIAQAGDATDPSGADATWPMRPGNYCRKAINEALGQAETFQNDYDFIDLRFAEVILNYAEIAIEGGSSSEVYDMLKQIRKRAGIEAGSDELYGLKAGMTKEEMRTAVALERRIEFAFEGKRMWDLRRTRKWNDLNGMIKHGILAKLKPGLDLADAQKRASEGTLASDEFTYETFVIVGGGVNEMVVPESYYFFPINKSSIDNNKNLIQNEGWGGTFKPTLD